MDLFRLLWDQKKRTIELATFQLREIVTHILFRKNKISFEMGEITFLSDMPEDLTAR